MPAAPLHQPVVRIAEGDYDRLANLARGAATGAALLAREVERAFLLSEAQAAAEAPFVRLGSIVEYRDLSTGRVRRVEVTAPDAADIDLGRLSVLSPVGAALIGLSAGDSFGWTGEDGRSRGVAVNWVAGPNEAPAGASPGAA